MDLFTEGVVELVVMLSWGEIAYRLEGRPLNRENPVSNHTGKFDQPTLPQFTQLYKCVPGHADSGGHVNE